MSRTKDSHPDSARHSSMSGNESIKNSLDLPPLKTVSKSVSTRSGYDSQKSRTIEYCSLPPNYHSKMPKSRRASNKVQPLFPAQALRPEEKSYSLGQLRLDDQDHTQVHMHTVSMYQKNRKPKEGPLSQDDQVHPIYLGLQANTCTSTPSSMSDDESFEDLYMDIDVECCCKYLFEDDRSIQDDENLQPESPHDHTQMYMLDVSMYQESGKPKERPLFQDDQVHHSYPGLQTNTPSSMSDDESSMSDDESSMSDDESSMSDDESLVEYSCILPAELKFEGCYEDASIQADESLQTESPHDHTQVYALDVNMYQEGHKPKERPLSQDDQVHHSYPGLQTNTLSSTQQTEPSTHTELSSPLPVSSQTTQTHPPSKQRAGRPSHYSQEHQKASQPDTHNQVVLLSYTNKTAEHFSKSPNQALNQVNCAPGCLQTTPDVTPEVALKTAAVAKKPSEQPSVANPTSGLPIELFTKASDTSGFHVDQTSCLSGAISAEKQQETISSAEAELSRSLLEPKPKSRVNQRPRSKVTCTCFNCCKLS